MEPPIKPNESDCCNSGCNPCILDVYEEQLRKYRQNRHLKITKNKNCILGTAYTSFRLVQREKHCKDALLLTFKYDGNSEDDLGLIWEPGQYFLLKSGTEKNEFTRAYTPIPYENYTDLEFTVLVKLYRNGLMSRYLKNLTVNSRTFWRGPYGNHRIPQCRHLLFIAQGSGIAPIYAIIQKLLNDKTCEMFLKLFYCCKTVDMIYLRDVLHQSLSNWNFTYEVFLSSSEGLNVKYNEVVHQRKLIRTDLEFYLKENDDVNVIVAGSGEFMNSMRSLLLQLGVDGNNVQIF